MVWRCSAEGAEGAELPRKRVKASPSLQQHNAAQGGQKIPHQHADYENVARLSQVRPAIPGSSVIVWQLYNSTPVHIEAATYPCARRQSGSRCPAQNLRLHAESATRVSRKKHIYLCKALFLYRVEWTAIDRMTVLWLQLPEVAGLASADVNGFVGLGHGLPYGHMPQEYAATHNSLVGDPHHRVAHMHQFEGQQQQQHHMDGAGALPHGVLFQHSMSTCF